VQARSNNLGKETATTAIAPLATNRPDAMSLIQGYLSLCLPASIETQVNNAVASTDFELDPATKGSLIPTLRRVDIHTRNQIQLENNIQNRNQFESGNRIGRINAQTQLEPEKPSPTAIKNAQTSIEKGLSRSAGIKIQEALCVVGDGDFGKTERSETRKAIKLYQAVRDVPEAERDGKLNYPADRDALIAKGACIGKEANYLNAYERFMYQDKAAITTLQKRINNELAKLDLTPLLLDPFSGSFDAETRDAIQQLKEKKGITERLNELTPDLDEDIDA
jgi:hypothetical protein